MPDMNWLYPQNVHMHQDNGSEMVPLFSYENLKKATTFFCDFAIETTRASIVMEIVDI